MNTKYETRYLFNIIIKEVGLIKRIAFSKWEAIDQAYSEYREQQPNRQLYTARRAM
jgi:hypothetical protein